MFGFNKKFCHELHIQVQKINDFFSLLFKKHLKDKLLLALVSFKKTAASPSLQLTESLQQLVLALQEQLGADLAQEYLHIKPWYLVLGSPQSGKTNLIEQASDQILIKFQSTNDTSQDIKPSCNLLSWMVAKQGIFLELSVEHEITALADLITDINLIRVELPLNSVIVTLDARLLMELSTDKLLSYATDVQQNLEYLQTTFSTVLPIYLTVTKLDLLFGAKTYTKYQSENLKQALGFTFTHYNSMQSSLWQADFAHQYSQLMQRFNASLLTDLTKVANVDERFAMYQFVRQIAGFKELLYQFCQRSFTFNKNITEQNLRLLLRGLYFTAVVKPEKSYNIIKMLLAHQHQLSVLKSSEQEEVSHHTLFVDVLFNTIIYPESWLAQDINFVKTKSIFGIKRTKQSSKFMLSGVFVTLILLLSWQLIYHKNVQQSQQVQHVLEQYQTVARGDFTNVLNTLNGIYKLYLSLMQDKQNSSWFNNFGLSQTGELISVVNRRYLQVLQEQYVPMLAQDLAIKLTNTESFVEQLHILTMLKLLTEHNINADIMSQVASIMHGYFTTYWQQEFVNNVDLQNMLHVHLNNILKYILLGNEVNLTLNNEHAKLIEQIQDKLVAMPLEQRIYQNIKLAAHDNLQVDIDMQALIGKPFIMSKKQLSNNYVSSFFTPDGFKSDILLNSTNITKLLAVDLWALQKMNQSNFSTDELENLKAKILDLYRSDYIYYWQVAINNIDLAQVDTMTLLLDQLNHLVGQDKLINHLLVTLKEHTGEIFTLAQLSEQQLDTLIQAIEQVYIYLNAIYQAEDIKQAAFKALQRSDVNPISNLNALKDKIPVPFSNIINTIVDDAITLIKQEALEYLEIRWQQDVYNEYIAKIADHYPVNGQGKKDISIKDFNKFFNPKNGTLNKFYNNWLKNFMEPAGEKANNVNCLLNEQIIQQIKKLELIQDAFFNEQGKMQIPFTMQLQQLSSDKRRSIIDLNGEYLEYSHGVNRSITRIWPNDFSSVQRVKLLLSSMDNDSPRGITATGSWALFKLLDQAKISKRLATEIDYTFKINNGNVTYRIIADTQINAFDHKNLFSKFNLPKNIGQLSDDE